MPLDALVVYGWASKQIWEEQKKYVHVQKWLVTSSFEHTDEFCWE